LGFIEWKTLPDRSSAAGQQNGRKSTGEEAGKRREQEILLNSGKKTELEEDNNFKPAHSPHFQTAAVTISHIRKPPQRRDFQRRDSNRSQH
jgi:hypothetical protein